ncbi:MAG: hypothetical protein HQ464_08415 [Planctomycetes bacterium]|nr:hypothetical protein [Planctomycetota bacterium]
MTRRGVTAVGLIASICLLSSGCGGGKEMGRVSGTATYRGKPVPDAVVRFPPKQKPPGLARTDDKGRYTLNTLRKGDGGFAGTSVVTITPWIEPLDSITGGKPPPERPRPNIPERYRQAATSPLTAEVVAGKNNVIDFKLD